MKLKSLNLPPSINYVGAFLTYSCNMNCSYCINKHDGFIGNGEMSTLDWIRGLSRIKVRPDLPITLQGGEPTFKHGFYKIVNGLYALGKHLDLLTNGLFVLKEFTANVPQNAFRSSAPYAGIRLSFHAKTNAFMLVTLASDLQKAGYSVGIWGLDHPMHEEDNDEITDMCVSLGIDFRLKDFLGLDKDKVLWGSYRYKGAVCGKNARTVLCKGSEILIGPSGHLYRCHHDLYNGVAPYGHILDRDITLPGFIQCSNYGHCSPCDIKEKVNRLQQHGHCAVVIKEVGGGEL